MIERQTVLVLGAGASCPYGLPLGSELRQTILQMSDKELRSLPIGRGQQRLAHIASTFSVAFRGSRAESIDSFLARRAEFVDIGKHAIAAALLPRESADRLLNQDVGDDWYTYLLRRMDAPWEDLPSNKISFVTFNYDRSLELCLTHAFQHRYGKTQEEAMDMLQHFPIVHVYGSLGSLDPRNPGFVPYGGGGRERYHDCIQEAAAGLRIISEGRDESPELMQARHLISKADALCFLGFGFDATNISRLGGREISAGFRETNGGMYHLAFASTAFGLTRAEAYAAADSICAGPAQSRVREGMHDATCLQTLRESLII